MSAGNEFKLTHYQKLSRWFDRAPRKYWDAFATRQAGVPSHSVSQFISKLGSRGKRHAETCQKATPAGNQLDEESKLGQAFSVLSQIGKRCGVTADLFPRPEPWCSSSKGGKEWKEEDQPQDGRRFSLAVRVSENPSSSDSSIRPYATTTLTKTVRRVT